MKNYKFSAISLGICIITTLINIIIIFMNINISRLSNAFELEKCRIENFRLQSEMAKFHRYDTVYAKPDTIQFDTLIIKPYEHE